ncbi:MAG TPA: TIGR03620 family F420-dependent LLM class oxidoreductase [Solirubrobacteraceae bacterium]|jgi:probable F420-dependent oxidoreductase|nr:TIGR03620 family F420-dependent LLM class oxidoreductase [Solirubrobacteraceae bacterium]
MELTKYGLWIGRSVSEEHHGEAAHLAEALGYGALWLGSSPRLPKLRSMLEASERIVIATGIVNIWAYDAAQLAEEFAALEDDFPGRVLLGIGIGHPEATQEYEKPLTKTRKFLDGIAASEHPVPRERMALAALGPKMLDLSYERALGTHPYFTPPAHTSFARERLGAEALVAPEQAVVIDENARAALMVARQYAGYYLGLSNYVNNLRRFGYCDEALADGGSRELVEELVPQGSAEQAAVAVHAHLDAGANHVCVQTLRAGGSAGLPERAWRELAAVLIG